MKQKAKSGIALENTGSYIIKKKITTTQSTVKESATAKRGNCNLNKKHLEEVTK